MFLTYIVDSILFGVAGINGEFAESIKPTCLTQLISETQR